MASNDSNEPGNTAAAAFQVGDRVRFPLNTIAFSGTVQAVFERNPDGSGLLAVADGEENVYYVNARNLTLISRATPAPAQAAHDGYDDDVSFSLFCHTNRHEQCHNPDCACSCHDDTPAPSEPATPAPAGYSCDDALYECPNLDCEMVAVTPLVRTSDGALCCPECKTELVQPATPAPAATPPALDTHTAPPSIFGKLLWCAMGGDTWAAWDQACRLGNVPPDVTLANLMEAAVRLGVNRAIDLLK